LSEREISWADIQPFIKRLWKPALIALLAGGVAGYLIAFTLPLKWRAQAIIQIEEPPSTRSLGLFGSYQSLIPQGIGGGYGARAFAFLKSNDLALRMTEREDVNAYLFKRRWNADKKTWKDEPPNKAERVEKFREILNLDQNEMSGLVYVSVDAPSADAALIWTEELIVLADEVAQDEETARLRKGADLIREVAADQAIAEYREALFEVLSQKMVDAFLMESEPVFSYRMISSAVRPDRASWPKKRWVALVAGLVTCMVVVVPRLRRTS